MNWTWLAPIVGFFYRIYIGSGLYYTWSRFWRWALEGRYRHYKIRTLNSADEISHTLGQMVWTSDPLGGAFDVISLPGKVQAVFDEAQREGRAPRVGDCDDFAAWAGAQIVDLRGRGLTDWRDPKLMTVAWYDKKGKWHAHVVCLFFDGRTYAHIGNWYRGDPQQGFKTVGDVARGVARAGGAGRLVAYSVGELDLSGPEVLHVGP